MNTYHIIKHSRGWALTKSGAKRATKVFPMRHELISHAKRFLKGKGAKLYIHDRAGMVEDTYSL